MAGIAAPAPKTQSDVVVAIGIVAENQRHCVASGFFYGFPAGVPIEEHGYEVFLVTNQHVLEGQSQMFLRVNPRAMEPARDFGISLTAPDGRPQWTTYPQPQIDVAVLPIKFGLLKSQGMQVEFVRHGKNAATSNELRTWAVTEGDEVSVLGFPLGQTGFIRNVAILRRGSVARIEDLHNTFSETFLIDASIFPGNSGGPVFLNAAHRPPGSTPWLDDGPTLVGLVEGYLPSPSPAIGAGAAGQGTMYIQQNSGLAVVQTVDSIDKTILMHRINKGISADARVSY